MPNPFQTISNAMDPTAPKPKGRAPAPPPPATVRTGKTVTNAFSGPSQDPTVKAEIAKRMAAQDAAAKKKPKR